MRFSKDILTIDAEQEVNRNCKRQDGQLLSERKNMAVVGILSTQLLHNHFIESFPAYPIEESKDVKVYG